MATIAEFRIPASDTALGATFHAVPSLVCEIEPVIAADEFGIWMSDVDHAALNAALRADRTVRDHSLITREEAGWLYAIDFSTEITENFAIVTEADGTMLAASARTGMWTIRVRFPARENASRVYERLAARDIQIEITQLRSRTPPTAAACGLSPEQYEALTAALTAGYFEIPREISLGELAGNLDISHQALSERLRRAYRTLVTASLEVDTRSDCTGGDPGE